MARWPALLAIAALGTALACGGETDSRRVVTFPASVVGEEAEILGRQLAAFEAAHPDIRVERRETPDAADRRRQLYVQWLNAGTADPDVLQLDVIWTPEFAAAGWILPLDRFQPETADFFPAALDASRPGGRLHAIPWFVDVGMLYWRSDLLEAPPATLAELAEWSRADAEGPAGSVSGSASGFVWQGARYEGLVTVFLEILGGYGGSILDESGRVTVDSPQAVQALAWLLDLLEQGASPREVTTWQEEPVRFAFQNGRALFMRNWPYAAALLSEEGESRVAGRFGVAPMPAAPGGRPTSALGGAQLAINANSDEPEAAWAVIAYLTHPERMRARARAIGQYPPRPSLYEGDALAGALAVPPDRARAIVERARPRPVTPRYSELSEILQIRLHECLTGASTPEEALRTAAEEMRRRLGAG